MIENQAHYTRTCARRRDDRPVDWHPADIKAAMAKRGYSFARLSREMGYKARNVPNQVLIRPYPKIEQAVAKVIGVPAECIWPSRYASQSPPAKDLPQNRGKKSRRGKS